jgi:outer membrane lipoprotein carrier protein
VLVWIAGAALAAEPALDTLLAQLTRKYAPAEVLRGTFVQTTGSPYGDQTQSGTVVLKRPGRMRWEFAGDGKQFVSDGSTLWIYTPADKQVIRVQGFGSQAATADAVLQSMDKLGQLYQVALGVNTSQSHELILTPKPGEDAQFSKLVLKLDAQLVIDEVVITDPFSTVTRLDFQTLEVGGAVKDDVFTFRVPAGVQVVDAGG